MEQTIWQTFTALDITPVIEEKDRKKYLSWAIAWAIVKEHFPDATYRNVMFDGKPYLFDSDLGYLVMTEVTIGGQTLPMQLPVMDGVNKAQKNAPYTYQVAEYKDGKKTGKMTDKTVEAATMYDINKTTMRCLVKNIALFGLGLHLYVKGGQPFAKTTQTVTSPASTPPPPKDPAKEITLKEIQAIFPNLGLSDTEADKKIKTDVLEAAFGTNSWKAVQQLPIEILKVALDKLEKFKDMMLTYIKDSAEAGIPFDPAMAYEFIYQIWDKKF